MFVSHPTILAAGCLMLVVAANVQSTRKREQFRPQSRSQSRKNQNKDSPYTNPMGNMVKHK